MRGGFASHTSSVKKMPNPVCAGIVALSVVCFVGAWAGNADLFFRPLALGFGEPMEVWRWLTWPIATGAMGPLGILFGCLWLWSMGGVVERELGSMKFGLFVLSVTLLSAAMAVLGGAIVGIAPLLAGLWVMLVAVTIAWGTRYPTMPVTFMFVLPLQGKWLAWISVALLVFAMDYRLAPFLAVPLALAYLFAADKLPIRYSARPVATGPTKRQIEREGRYFDDVKRRETEREEKERLRRLFERSLIEDPDERK